MKENVGNLKNKAAFILFSGGSLIIFLHIVARLGNFYPRFIWFDTVPHFFAGATAVGGALWILAVFKPNTLLTAGWGFGVFVFALVAGVFWEILEYVGPAFKEPDYVLDTTIDFLMHFLGASILIFTIKNQLKKTEQR